MAEVKGTPRHFHHKYKFLIEIDNIGSMQFQNCSELKMEVAKIEYYEGGVILPFKEAGRMTVSDLTLERAATSSQALYDWIVDVATAATNSGLVSNDYKRGGHIVQYDRNNGPLRTWGLFGIWPMSFVAGAWDNNSDELTMEQVVFALDYFELHMNNEVGKSPSGEANAIAGIARAVTR